MGGAPSSWPNPGASTSLRPHTTSRSTYLRSIQATNCSSCAPGTQPVPRPAPADNATPPTKPAETNERPGKQINLGQRPGKGPVRVHSSLDIVDQTALFTSMDPHQEQFIPPPRLNAGALPLAFESDLPLSQFPPFRPKKEKGGG